VWSWPFLHERAADAAPRPPFASAGAALFWLDWHRNGYVLPFLISMTLGSMLGAIVVLGAGKLPELVAGLFLVTLATVPPLMAAAAGASLGNTRTWAPPTYTMPAFTAARPIAASQIIAAKLGVGLRIFLITWAVSLIVLLTVVPFTEIAAPLSGWARFVIDMEGTHGTVLLGLAVPVLAVLSLKAMVDHLWIGLSGRIWINIAFGAGIGATWIGLTGVITWINAYPETHPWLLAAVPWLVGVALALKVGSGMLVGQWLLRRDLAAPGTLLRFALAFAAAAAVLVGLAFWLTPPEFCHPLVAGAVAIVLLLPMVRLGLAPLALDWNRHR
jgi:hypothetical protein